MAALVGACATPTADIERQAAEAGLLRAELPGHPFLHLGFIRPGSTGSALHVYLENDGQPWRFGSRVAADPTPRRPLMLQAMLADPAGSLYLGRPCYFLADRDPACGPLMWTHRRYAPEVVDSLEAALRAYLRDRPRSGLVFFGHSGGGTLALLLAARFAETRAVVTVAANLDVGGWAALHDYSPLTGSLDPIDRPPLPARVFQWHLTGQEDREIPPELALAYAARHPEARVDVLAGQDHVCCWLSLWPRVLARVEEEIRAGGGAAPVR